MLAGGAPVADRYAREAERDDRRRRGEALQEQGREAEPEQPEEGDALRPRRPVRRAEAQATPDAGQEQKDGKPEIEGQPEGERTEIACEDPGDNRAEGQDDRRPITENVGFEWDRPGFDDFVAVIGWCDGRLPWFSRRL